MLNVDWIYDLPLLFREEIPSSHPAALKIKNLGPEKQLPHDQQQQSSSNFRNWRRNAAAAAATATDDDDHQDADNQQPQEPENNMFQSTPTSTTPSLSPGQLVVVTLEADESELETEADKAELETEAELEIPVASRPLENNF
jgi:hypothetical protein